VFGEVHTPARQIMHRRFANELDEPSNGNLAGFSGSLVDVQITGGEAVPYSNITLTFGGSASSHFGHQPLHGVVTPQ